MSNIKYGQLDNFNKIPNTYIGVIPAEITTKQDLLKSYATIFKFPGNFCDNWDYFDELLSDFSWLPDKNFIVYHNDIPNIGNKNILILLQILNNTSHSEPYAKNQNLIQSFIVFFPEQYKQRIESILEKIEKMDTYQFQEHLKNL